MMPGELLGDEPEAIICPSCKGFVQLRLRVNGELSGRRMLSAPILDRKIKYATFGRSALYSQHI